MTKLGEWGQQDMMYHSMNKDAEKWTGVVQVGTFKFSIDRI